MAKQIAELDIKKTCLILGLLCFYSNLALAQETQTRPKTGRYFISANAGVLKTPIGFRIGLFEKTGGYIGARFGKGSFYDKDMFNNYEETSVILFSTTVGLILFPTKVNDNFKAHTFFGVGYGSWFERLSKNGTTIGCEFEGGLMISNERLILSLGGNLLLGDGSTPKGDLTIGIGYRLKG